MSEKRKRKSKSTISLPSGKNVKKAPREMLKRDAVKNANGHDLSRSNSTSTSKPRLHPQVCNDHS